jgi:hypothetical protein
MKIAKACPCCSSYKLQNSPAVLMPFLSDRIFGWSPCSIDSSWNLTTIEQGKAYSICNSVECRECGLLFLDMRFDDEELALLYSDYRGLGYTDLRNKYEPGYATKNIELNQIISYKDNIEKFLQPLIPKNPRVLDWGGDTGKNTPFLGKSEYLHIYDISQKQTVPGTNSVQRADLRNFKYDLVICSNVLEHVPYPAVFLKSLIDSISNKDAVLYIELPYEEIVKKNKGKKDLQRIKKHWHEHINFFTEESLRTLLSRLDLKILKFEILDTEILKNTPVSVFQLACRKS